MRSPLLPILALSALLGCPGGSGGTDTETSSSSSTTESPTTGAACGDGAIAGDEVCDGDDLGGKTCADVDPNFVGGQLACSNDCMSLDASGCELGGAGSVKLNELSSGGALAGPWMGKGDLVELFNAGTEPVDLSGWQLADDMTLPPDRTYVFPDGTSLGPKQWLVLSEFDMATAEGDFPFGLSQSAIETLVLVTGGGQTVDTVTFDGFAAAVSYCRVPDGTGEWQHCEQTFEAANAAAASYCGDGAKDDGEECDGADLGSTDCAGLGVGFTGGALACTPTCSFDATGCDTGASVVINELESTADDIEIYNDGAAAVDLSGWILTDDFTFVGYDPVMDGNKMIFAPLTSIGAKEYLVVKKGMGQNEHPFGLSADGDTVTLLDPNGQVVDLVTYAMDQAVTSLCRLPDGPDGTWTAVCTPSLGAPNQP